MIQIFSQEKLAKDDTQSSFLVTTPTTNRVSLKHCIDRVLGAVVK